MNLSVWRDDQCVGTVRLRPDDVAVLVSGLTDGLADLARRPVEPTATVAELVERLDRVESQLTRPAWRTAVGRLRAMVGRTAGSMRRPAP